MNEHTVSINFFLISLFVFWVMFSFCYVCNFDTSTDYVTDTWCDIVMNIVVKWLQVLH